jgi:hypothetical protein
MDLLILFMEKKQQKQQTKNKQKTNASIGSTLNVNAKNVLQTSFKGRMTTQKCVGLIVLFSFYYLILR